MTARHARTAEDARLFLTTLGSATLRRVHHAGDELLLEAGKPLALIAHLAASPNRGGSRDQLINLLWTNLEPPEARRAVRQTLWYIRRKVGDEALAATNDHLTLDPRIETDRDQFIDAWNAGDFKEVVRRYTGDFLIDFAALGADEFEAWAEHERRRLRGFFAHAASALAREHAGSGRYREAQTLARRVRDLELLNQAGWRLLLECLVASGDTIGTAVEVDALERLLDSEEIEPEAATRNAIRVARNIGQHDPDRAPDESHRLVVDLVGREREFAALRTAWDHARGRRAALLHIVAPAGLGKTRLLGDLRTRLRAGKGCVVHARADYGARDISYAFAGDVAAALAECRGALGISPQSASSLVALNPSLSSVYKTTPDMAADDEALRRRALAVRELIVSLTEEQTVALLLDDLHWSDERSVQLLKASFSGLDQHQVLIVSAARPVARGTLAVSQSTQLILNPLTAEDVGSLLSSIALLPNATWADDVAAALCTATSGSPLLLFETLQLLTERGLLSAASGSVEDGSEAERLWTTVDPAALIATLEEGSALQRRIESLAASEREVLLCLASAGMPLSVSRLRDATSGASARLDVSLALLEQRGLVTRFNDTWSTAHDEHASAVLAMATKQESRTAAIAVGRAIAKDATGDSRDLRVAATLLVHGGDIETLKRVYEKLVTRQPPTAGRSLEALSRELLGPAATDALARTLVRSLPIGVRVRHRLSRPGLVAAAAAGVLISAAAGAAGWAYTRPQPPPDAVAVAMRMGAESSALELFEIPIDASRWAGVGMIDVDLSGSPRWKLPPLGFLLSASDLRPDRNGWTFGRAVPDSGVLDIVDLDLRGREQRLTFTAGDDFEPSWAPDQSAFAFTTMRWNERAHYDIALFDAATQTVRQLTSGDDTDFHPLWSPDGSRIAFLRYVVTTTERSVCVMDADGQNLRCLAAEQGKQLMLVGWSDPRRMVTQRVDERRLAIIDVDTDRSELIDPGVSNGATLSPNGRWILCVCARRGYPVGSWFVYPLERPNEFKVLGGTTPLGDSITFDWSPTTQRAPYLHQLRITSGLGSPIVGATHQLRLSGLDSAGAPLEPGVIRWRSLDTTMALIDSTGLVTPRRAGSVIIEASAGGWRRIQYSLAITEPVTRVLLDERWAIGLAPTWRSYGSPRPEIVTGPPFGHAFWNHGDQAFYSGAYTISGFPTANGLWAEASLSSPVTATEWQRNAIALLAIRDSTAWMAWDHVTGDGAPNVPIPLCELSYPAAKIGQPPIDAIVVGGSSTSRVVAPPAGSDTGRPFRVVMQILPDGRCGSAIDGKVVWIGRPDWIDPIARVRLAGNSVDTKMLVGPLRVGSGIAPGIDWSSIPPR